MRQRKKEGSREWEDQVKIHEQVQERHTTGIGTEGNRKGKHTYEECGKLNEWSHFLIALRNTDTPILLLWAVFFLTSWGWVWPWPCDLL